MGIAVGDHVVMSFRSCRACSRQLMIPRLIEMRAAGTFALDHLVTTYPVTEINTAVADVTAGTVLKPVLVW